MYQNQIVSLIGLIFPEEENASASFALFQVRSYLTNKAIKGLFSSFKP